MSIPDELSLLSLFECEPKLLDNNAPYFYNEATYEFNNYSNERFVVNVCPSNALHSNLKRWMGRFNGVATKYITNYLYWFKWLQTFSTEKESVRTKNFLVQSNVTYSYTKVIDFKERQPIYV